MMSITQPFRFLKKVIPVLALGLSACATNYPQPTSAKPGMFEYQYTLYETRPAAELGATRIPARNTPYRLFLLDNRNVFDNQSVYHGKTDNDGKTIVVHSATEIKPEDVVLVKRVGDGKLGRMFTLILANTNDPAAGMLYQIEMRCPKQPLRTYKGYTDDQGNSIYITNDRVCEVNLQTLPY